MADKPAEKLSGKVTLVTGSSRGIGRAVALAYAKEGAKVFLCARNEAELERAASEIRAAGGEAAFAAIDLARDGAGERLVREVEHRYGALDVLVNNAGILGPRAPIATYPIDAWEEVIHINVTSTFAVTQAALRLMMARRQGSIINISSGVGRIGKARWGAYAVSKFAVEGLTQVLADELKDWNIRANAVNPGGTRTAMRAEAYPEEDPGTLPTAEEITPVFIYLASEQSAAITGQSLDARRWVKK
ncbi:MAG TPA: YciK family oxidoreductase [Candidatus Binatia bacterium]|jgi:NAD(P)-dependent dehydrogenase (short-subunit alcohol dehydrogenase family)|nr:YciK family oxidoreductase [Candidatus Binatia bacterium]